MLPPEKATVNTHELKTTDKLTIGKLTILTKLVSRNKKNKTKKLVSMHKDLVQIIKRNTLYCYYNFHASVQMKKKKRIAYQEFQVLCYSGKLMGMPFVYFSGMKNVKNHQTGTTLLHTIAIEGNVNVDILLLYYEVSDCLVKNKRSYQRYVC